MITMTIKQAIDLLPTKADDIASFLASLGITGECSNQISCPLARYVSRKTGKVAAVNYETVSVINLLVSDFESYPLTRGCQLFTLRFDDGGYPLLIERNRF